MQHCIFFVVQHLLILLLLCMPSSSLAVDSSPGDNTDTTTIAPTLRWASTGGGWRSQFACVGFANLFGQLGIMSKFSAISTASGASWFSTQLFYSQQFYNRVVDAEDSQALYDFVVEWMNECILTNAHRCHWVVFYNHKGIWGWDLQHNRFWFWGGRKQSRIWYVSTPFSILTGIGRSF